MRHVTSRFDERVKNFCVSIAQRRNSELHSGDAPFRAMKLDAWEAQYWHDCDLILSQAESSLDEWLGADTAKAPKTVLKHALSARKDAARERIRSCKLTFEALKPSEQKLALAQGAAGTELQHAGLFSLLSDLLWDEKCPACGGKAYLAGIQTGEEITQDGDGYSAAWENVETTYSPEQFRCPVCSLSLEGYDELEVADLEFDHTTVEAREFEYEPEYGND